MPTNAEWQKCLRWQKEVDSALTFAAANGSVPETERVFAHMMIESKGEPKANSGEAYGLMQITSPENAGVDYDTNRIFEPGYNILIGIKVMQAKFSQCNTWRGASQAYFTGRCEISQAKDKYGTTGSYYDEKMTTLMAEVRPLIGKSGGIPVEEKDKVDSIKEREKYCRGLYNPITQSVDYIKCLAMQTGVEGLEQKERAEDYAGIAANMVVSSGINYLDSKTTQVFLFFGGISILAIGLIAVFFKYSPAGRIAKKIK